MGKYLTKDTIVLVHDNMDENLAIGVGAEVFATFIFVTIIHLVVRDHAVN